jgi:putative SOS response-associated peptidase YedK
MMRWGLIPFWAKDLSVSESGQPLTYFIDKDQLGTIRDHERNMEPFAKQVSAAFCAIWHAAIVEMQPILPMRIETIE